MRWRLIWKHSKVFWKKCKFINDIDFNTISDITNKEQTLLLINKYCEHLKTIRFVFTGISYEAFTQFGLKFAHSLKSFGVFQKKNPILTLLYMKHFRSLTNNLKLIIERKPYDWFKRNKLFCVYILYKIFVLSPFVFSIFGYFIRSDA
jgi:hypothetical protein